MKILLPFIAPTASAVGAQPIDDPFRRRDKLAVAMVSPLARIVIARRDREKLAQLFSNGFGMTERKVGADIVLAATMSPDLKSKKTKVRLS